MILWQCAKAIKTKNPSIIGNNARIKMRLLGIIHGDGNMSYGRLLITDMSREFNEGVIRPMQA